MAFPLCQYVKIKDKYCLCYLGWNEEHIKHLVLSRPAIEEAFPGIQVFLSFRDEFCYLCEGQPRIVPMSQLKAHHREMAHIRELKSRTNENPILAFLKESSVPVPAGIS